MNINPSIFKEYDIRGIYPDEIDINVAYRIGASFVEFVKRKQWSGPIVIGRDARRSSPELHEALVQGVCDHGRDVMDVGVTSTPLFYFSVIHGKAAAGIMITASHNPKEYNGFKFVGEEATPIGFEDGIRMIRDISGEEPTRGLSQGKVTVHDFSEKYLDFIYEQGDIARPVTVVVDASNGSAGELTRKFFTRLTVDYKPLFLSADGNFPNHGPDPLQPESIRAASEKIIETASEFGVVIDGDGDRIVFLNENGKRVRSDIVGAFLADMMLKAGDIAVTTKTATKAFTETVEEKGGKVIFSKVGHSNIKKTMRKHKAVFGVEPSGHMYFGNFYFLDSSLLALQHVLSFFSKQEKSFSELMRAYGPYESYERNFSVADRLQSISLLRNAYADGSEDDFDGLTVSYPDWWFNVRASNTEPLLRLTVEAKTKELLAEKQAELEEYIRALSSSERTQEIQ